MPLPAFGSGRKVGTGLVPIKPDATGFGADLERQVGSEAKGSAGRIGTAASAAFAGAFAAGAATIGKSVLDFAGFDKQMREVFTLLPDISAPAMDEMTQQVKDFAGEFGVLPTEVVPALYQSLSAGVPRDNVFAFLEESQKLAKGGVTELATAVDGLSSVVNAYGAENITAAEASDMMFTTVKLGKTTIDDLSTNLFQVTPIASSLGVGFDQVSASMATLTLVTGNTSVASTQLKAALAELGKGGSTAFDSFVEATGQTFPEFIAAGGTVGEGLVKMQEYAEANGKSLGDMFGSVEAGQAALVLAKDNAAAFSSSLTAMEGSAGATDQAFDTMNTGLSATMDRLKARFSITLLDIGANLAPTVESWGLAIAGVLDIINALPGPMRTAILLFATAGAGLAALAGPILKAVQLFSMLGKTMALLATNPWFLAIGLLVLGAYLVITHWEEVSAFFVEFGEVMADVWSSVTETTTAWATATWETVTGIFTDLGNFFAEWWPYLLGIFTGGIGLIVVLIWDNWDAIYGKTVEVTDGIADKFAGAFQAAHATVTGVGGQIVSFITGIPNAIAGAFVNLATTISKPFTTAFAAIKSAWNAGPGGFGFDIPGWVPQVGGKGFHIPNMAAGGVLTAPTLFVGGEYPAAARNPEIVTPQNVMRETVTAAIAEAGGGGLELHAHLHVDGNVDRSWFAAQLEGFSTELVRVAQRELERDRRGAGRATLGLSA